ncbi:MAG TPA: (2Fe-2S)-binding protein, partial [Acidobacteriota bacterium]|nr:(2Fe-2S)-binding protein [Acidobacteriota bacterium]
MPVDLTDFNPIHDVSQAGTMPARWYNDPEIFQLEKQKIFWSTWQPVARADLLTRPGDFFACD